MKSDRVHLEGVRHGVIIRAVARASTIKPVIALHGGRGRSRRLCAIAYRNSWGRLRSPQLRSQAGAIVVESNDAAIDAAAAFAAGRIPPKAIPAYPVLTGQAGPGSSYRCVAHGGVDVPPGAMPP